MHTTHASATEKFLLALSIAILVIWGACIASLLRTPLTPVEESPLLVNNDNSLPANPVDLAEEVASTAAAAVADEPVVETPTDTPSPVVQETVFLDIPLDVEVQRAIFEDVCEGDLGRFAMLMAVAAEETRGSFDNSCVGDESNSFSMFQINIKWHLDRLAKFGYSIEDLSDPVKAARVALDYLEEIMAKEGLTEMAHRVYVIYNAGHYTTHAPSQEGATRVMQHYDNYVAAFTAANPWLTA